MDFSTLAKALMDAFAAHNYSLLCALSLVGAVAFMRWLAPKLHDGVGDFLNSDRGGAILALLGGLGAAYSTAFATGAPVSAGILLDGLGVAVTAAGGYSLFKKFFSPSDTAPKAV